MRKNYRDKLWFMKKETNFITRVFEKFTAYELFDIITKETSFTVIGKYNSLDGFYESHTIRNIEKLKDILNYMVHEEDIDRVINYVSEDTSERKLFTKDSPSGSSQLVYYAHNSLEMALTFDNYIEIEGARFEKLPKNLPISELISKLIERTTESLNLKTNSDCIGLIHADVDLEIID
jgi:hypothetical protein